MRRLAHIITHRSGATAIEYALLAGLIAIVVASALNSITSIGTEKISGLTDVSSVECETPADASQPDARAGCENAMDDALRGRTEE